MKPRPELPKQSEKLGRVLGEHIFLLRKRNGAPTLHHGHGVADDAKQSNDTKTLNPDKDLEEIMDKVKQAGWNESTKTKRFWTQDGDEDQ